MDIHSRYQQDYIFKADAAIPNIIPGDTNCHVIHPELEKDVNGIHLIANNPSNKEYSFIGSWKELSDHYPVFMEFDAPAEPTGDENAKRTKLKVEKTWGI